jgi:hypothetical protein
MDYFYRVINVWASQESPDEIEFFRDSEYEEAVALANKHAQIEGYGLIVVEKVFFKSNADSDFVLQLKRKQKEEVK